MSESAAVESAAEPFDQAIMILARLSDQDFDRVQNALDDMSTPLSRKALIQRVKETAGLNRADSSEIVNSVGGIASALLEAPSRSEDGELELARQIVESSPVDADKDRAAERLSTLAAAQGLRASVKASRLQLHHGHLFRRAEIVSDLRPVFGGPAEVDPTGFMIWHTLRVQYSDGVQESVEQESFEVAMDGRDLEVLKDAVERAIRKHKALRSKLSDLSVTHYAVGDLREDSDG